MAPTTANDLHGIERARRPKTLARAAFWADVARRLRSSSPTALDDRGDRAPAITRAGTSASSVQKGGGVGRAGGPSTTACPFAPPIPELVIATSGRLSGARTLSGSGLSGTRSRYCDHLMAGFGRDRFTLGGISPVSKMPHTLQRDARKAVISRCLWGL